jgi:hypothetical protein
MKQSKSMNQAKRMNQLAPLPVPLVVQCCLLSIVLLVQVYD